jgi:acyl carrier protein
MFTNRDEIFRVVTDGLTRTFQLDPSRVTLGARLYDDLDIDSIDAVDLAALLQRETGMRLSAEVFKSVRTVGDLVDALETIVRTPRIDEATADATA